MMDEAQPQITLLRIKRKRNEEPLDGLVVDAPRKKHRDSLLVQQRGMFKYIHTVDQIPSFHDPGAAAELQTRISRLAEQNNDSPIDLEPPERVIGTPIVENSRHFSISKPIAPPSQSPSNLQSSAISVYEGVHSISPQGESDSVDNHPELVQFSEMVKDYLSAHAPEIDMADLQSQSQQGDDGDFVYDLFYYEASRPHFVSSGQNIASLMVNAGDDVEFLNLSDTESAEYNDDAEWDSNDEDNPANDYPDEESEDASSGANEWSDDGMEEYD
ncbi:hypothetical protein DL93DRAFT_254181 [Clavulina sp. PMI_390]|nr:hypothetical protein DL93DRAFT_254181 [Clavulina sp. PMI_390]